MNPGKIYRGALIAAFTMIWMAAPSWADQKPTAKENVAVVNGKAISQKEFDQEISPVLQRAKMGGQEMKEDRLKEVQKKTLENMIDREILYQECQNKEVKVSDTEVDQQLASFKSRFPDEAQFAEALKKMNLTEDIIKKQIREQLAIQKLVDTQIIPNIKISDANAKKYYDEHPNFFKKSEQIKASHILVKVDPKADDAAKAEARKKIEDVQKKLKEGGDFAALAKEVSECPSGQKGGDLGYFGRGQMVKPFEDVAFAAKLDEVSDIVETQFGYHLIKVADKKPATTVAYEEAKPRIEQVLKREGIRKEMNRYIEDLKKKAKIERLM